GGWLQPDPLMQHPSPYLALSNNPVSYTDPSGLWDLAEFVVTDKRLYPNWSDFNNVTDPFDRASIQADLVYDNGGKYRKNGEAYGEKASRYIENQRNSANVNYSGEAGAMLKGWTISLEKHFNGGLGTVGVAVQGYKKISNDTKRHYAYKLSKMTGVKSGKIFQGAKGFVNSTGKMASKLGPVGTVLGVGVASYEIGTGTWDAHTAVNIGLMLGAAAATFVGAPAVLTGIAVYGVGDYFFDFGGKIDRNVGRNSKVW
ncbi:MAG: hypothetical protein Q8R57_11455, partial [Bacteroidota bacterium]|nr:hypothetical protein [Bacteroidota bacterium]